MTGIRSKREEGKREDGKGMPVQQKICEGSQKKKKSKGGN